MNSVRGFSMMEVLVASALSAMVMMALLDMVRLVSIRQTQQGRLLELSSSQQMTERLARWVAEAASGHVHAMGLDNPHLSAYRSQQQSGTIADGSDQLLLQHAATDAGGHDCEGTYYVAGTRSVQRLFLRKDSATKQWALACDAGYCTDSSCTRLGDAGIIVLDNVSYFRVTLLLGEADMLSEQRLPSSVEQPLSPELPLRAIRIALRVADQPMMTWTQALDHHD